MSENEFDETKRDLLLGKLVSYAEANRVYSFYLALVKLIQVNSDNSNMASIIEMGSAFLGEREPNLERKIRVVLSDSFEKTTTLDQEWKLEDGKDKDYPKDLQTHLDANKSLTHKAEMLQVAEGIIGNFQDPTLKSQMRKLYKTQFAARAGKALNDGDFSKAMRFIGFTAAIQGGDKMRRPDNYIPLTDMLFDVMERLTAKEKMTGLQFAQMQQALSNALTLVPKGDEERRKRLSDFADLTANKAYDQNRFGHAATIEAQFCAKLSPFSGDVSEELAQVVENWEQEINALSVVDLDKAHTKSAAMASSKKHPKGHPLVLAAISLEEKFAAESKAVDDNVVPIKPEDFQPQFRQRVLKVA